MKTQANTCEKSHHRRGGEAFGKDRQQTPHTQAEVRKCHLFKLRTMQAEIP